MGPVYLGDFQLLTLLAKGGTGLVYGGVHKLHRTPVAVKVLAGDAARDEGYRVGFATEARTIAALNHPSIIRLFDQGEVDEGAVQASGKNLVLGAPYLVMERLDYGSMHTLRRLPAPWSVLHGLFCQVLEGLAYAHARGVVHRDLKPSNVLIATLNTNAVRIADFGLAHLWSQASGEVPLPGRIEGTPSYMAPEQATGSWRDWGPETDLYAFACMAWSLLTGVPPLSRGTAAETLLAQVNEHPPALLPRVPVPEGTEAWLLRMLQKARGDRFSCASDALYALKELGDRAGLQRQSDRARSPSPRGGGVGVEPSQSLTAIITPVPMPDLESGSVAPFTPRPAPVPTSSPPAEYRALEDASTAGAGLRMLGLRRPPLVGQEAARTLLWRALREVCVDRRLRVVVLEGPAGSGKTRLAEWIGANAAEFGYASTLRCDHSPLPGPMLGIPGMLARLFSCQRLSASACQRRLERVGGPLQREPVDDVRALTEVFAFAETPASAPLSRAVMEPAQRVRLLGRVLRTRCVSRPLVLVVDDAQWGHEALDVVRHLATEHADQPILVVVAARPEALAVRGLEAEVLGALRHLELTSHLAIPALPDPDMRKLITSFLPVDPVLSAQVEAKAGGNPAFALQLLSEWAQDGIMELKGGSFHLGPGAEAAVPETLMGVWKSRVRGVFLALSPSQRRAVQVAATLGHVVDDDEWHHVCDAMDARADVELSELLANRGLVRLNRGSGTWVFAHGGVRECVLESARAGGVLAAHHLAIADYLSSLPDPSLARIGIHLVEAGEPERAVEPLLQAGAVLQASNGDARLVLAYARRALDALGQAARQDNELRWWFFHARALGFEHNSADATQALARAWSLMADETPPILRGQIHLLQADLSLYAGGTDDALEHAEAAWALFDAHGDTVGQVKADVAMCAINTWIGQFDKAEQCVERAIVAAPKGSRAMALARIRRGDLNRSRGHLDSARADYLAAQQIAGDSGDLRLWSFTSNNLADVFRLSGDHTGARERYEEVLTMKYVDPCAVSLNLVLLDLADEDYDGVAVRLRSAPLLAAPLMLKGMVNIAHACCDAVASRWEEWDSHFADGQAQLAETMSTDRDIAAVAMQAGRLASAAGQADRARLALELAVQQWGAIGDDARRDEAKGMIAGLG